MVEPGPPPDLNPLRFDLVTMNEDGSGERVLLETPRSGSTAISRASGPAWAPTGDLVYFTGVVGEREINEARFAFA